jgi:FKBP-type peptidyl-prolyl cis-trans isomerase
MKKITLNLLSVLLVAAIAWSCSSKYPGFDKADSGLYYKLYDISKDTTKARTGDWVYLNLKYIAKVKGKDTLLFDSRAPQMGGEQVRFQLPPSDFKGDLYEAIGMLEMGDSGEFMINTDSLFIKTFKMPQRPAIIDSNSVLHFYVQLVNVESVAKMKVKEGELLTKYLADNKITAAPTATGIYILASNPGAGMKIDTGCAVQLHFNVTKIDGKEIFSSYSRPEPIKFQYGNRFDTPGLEEAVGTLKKGGKATIIVPSTMAFGEQGRGNLVGPYSTLIYNVEIMDVKSKADYEKEQAVEKKKMEKEQAEAKKKDDQKKAGAKTAEPKEREKYLKDNNVKAKPTASGLYYIEKAKGTGAQAVAGKKVKVHYTGTLLNGTKFDSSRDRNEPFEFVLGQGQVIKGWDEGIAMMKQGGKATLIIPSAIAYGDREAGSIPAYSTLVFDVELVAVEDASAPKK